MEWTRILRVTSPHHMLPGGAQTLNGPLYLDLLKKTRGNANGIGMADMTTKAVMNEIKWEKGYANALTSTVTDVVKLPMFLDTQELAVKAAIKNVQCLRFE
ncbi:hypothetical protein RCO48_22290 [Peribacillus frigoritolerans]|nr:hypothetical protein [Peribacillus frigoritolerans]